MLFMLVISVGYNYSCLLSVTKYVKVVAIFMYFDDAMSKCMFLDDSSIHYIQNMVMAY